MQDLLGTIPLTDTDQLFRIGIAGAPKTGKTWSALTFPNPVVLNFDNNLRGFQEVYPDKKIMQVPFWSNEFYTKVLGIPLVRNITPNARDGIRRWLEKEGSKLTPADTLILDSWTMYITKFDAQYDAEPLMTFKGEVDTFAFYRHKKNYSEQLLDKLKGLNCNVIVLFHEQQDRDDKGNPNGKLKPAMEGQFADKLAGFFTDWFRQVIQVEEVTAADGKTKKKVPRYMWQIRSDSLMNCGTSLRKLDRSEIGFIPAVYESLVK